MSIFQRYGHVYNLLIQREARWAHEGPLLTELAGTAGAGRRRVLDLACGGGFHAHALAGEGCTVVAVDESESMLNEAREKCPPGAAAEFHLCDVTEAPPGPYDLALLLGNTICALPDRQAFFAAVAQRLAAGGALLLHLVDYETLRRESLRHVVRRGMVAGRDTVVSKVMVGVPGGMVVAFTCQQANEAGWSVMSEQTELRDVPDSELRAAAGAAGLVCESVWSGMDRAPYRPGEGKDRVFLFRQPRGGAPA